MYRHKKIQNKRQKVVHKALIAEFMNLKEPLPVHTILNYPQKLAVSDLHSNRLFKNKIFREIKPRTILESLIFTAHKDFQK